MWVLKNVQEEATDTSKNRRLPGRVVSVTGQSPKNAHRTSRVHRDVL